MENVCRDHNAIRLQRLAGELTQRLARNPNEESALAALLDDVIEKLREAEAASCPQPHRDQEVCHG